MKKIYQALFPSEGRLGFFWLLLFVVNYFIMAMNRYYAVPIPLSLVVEICYILCIVVCSNYQKYEGNITRVNGPYLWICLPWIIYSILEVGNVAADIDYADIVTRWFAEVRTMAFQIVYGMLVCAALFVKKVQIRHMAKIWGILIMICTIKCLIQQYIGFDAKEQEFLVSAAKTHFVNGIIRYFSYFSDAANFGCNMAATTVVFGAFTLSCKSKIEKIFFAIITLCALYCMMASGTRTGIFVLGIGAFVYAILSKRTSAIIATLILGGSFFFILKFTDVGQGNSMIRRMRSAFNTEDASMDVREINQQAMKRYIDELPLGLGAGIRNGDIPPSNKNYFLSVVAPDSTWVYIDIHYGHIGKYLFLATFFLMCLLAGKITFFNIRDPELRGMLAALTSGASAMFVAGYANQIQLQFPNCLLFFGQLMIVYLGPDIDRRMQEEEKKKALEELNNPSQ